MKFIYQIEFIRVKISRYLNKVTGRQEARSQSADLLFNKVISSLKPGDLAIDLGANVGKFTIVMADTGADVIAFEPDPLAQKQLYKNVGSRDNVRIMPVAAGATSGSVNLLRNPVFDRNPELLTVASTVLPRTHQPSVDSGIRVQVINFIEFLENLHRPVRLIKIDIEGSEVDLMECLLNSEAIKQVDFIFVETHEWLYIEDAPRIRKLIKLTKNLLKTEVNWDWR